MPRGDLVRCLLASVIACCLGASGCNLVLGIKDLKHKSADAGSMKDEDAAVVQTGTGGKGTGGKGSTGNSGNGGTTGNGGSSGSGVGGAGAGGAATGGSGGESGAGGGTAGTGTGGTGAGGGGSGVGGGTGGSAGSNAGSGGSGGSTITVQGKLIDLWRHPLPNVPVTIGATDTTTDSNGAFSVADVTPPYDVALTITTMRSNATAKYGWLFQGLTRTDPTLQVYRGLPERLADPIMLSVTNAFPLSSTQKIAMDFASPDGEFNEQLTSDAVSSSSNTYAWVGPAITTGAAHALSWTFSNPQEIPVSYLAHAALTVALDSAVTTNAISFNLAPSTLAVGTVGGTVTSPTTTMRANSVFVRFSDGAAIQIVDDHAATGTFSYTVPSGLSNASMTVAASEGDYYYSPYAVAYRDGVAAGQSGIALSVPAPATIVTPGAGATMVDGSTMFQWTSSSHVFVLVAASNPTYDAFFVVTANKHATLPVFPVTQLALAANTAFNCYVETHGSYASVDEATADAGLLSAFANGRLRGPRTGAGEYTESVNQTFTSKP
jgi:hypothetical protein